MAKISQQQIKKVVDRGGTVSVIPKHVSIEGLMSLVGQLKDMMSSSVQSNSLVVEALLEVREAIESKEFKGTDTQEIVEALNKLGSSYEHCEFPDFIIDFDRDQRGLLKTGIRMRAEYNERTSGY